MKTQKLLIILLFFSTFSWAQQTNVNELIRTSKNFYDTKNKIEAYLNNQPTNSSATSKEANNVIDYEKDHEWIVYKRWEEEMSHRVMPDSSYADPIKVSQRVQSSANKTRTSKLGRWTCVDQTTCLGGYYGMGRVISIAAHPTDANTLYLGSDCGGLWKTTDSGATYTPLTDNLPILSVGNVLIDSVNPNNIYITLKPSNNCIGIYKSTDGGLNWNPTGLSFTPNQGVSILSVAMASTNTSTLIAATSVGLYKTTNGGDSWAVISAGNYSSVCYKPGSDNVVYAGMVATPAKIVKTTNGLNGWVDVFVDKSVWKTQPKIKVSKANPNFVAVVFSHWSDPPRDFDGHMFTSKNEGLNWADKGVFPGHYFGVSPRDTSIMIGGGLNHYRSANGGRSWTQKGVWTNGNAAVPTVHADTQDVTFSPVNTSNAFVANDGGMYIWNENTQAFTERTNGLIISMYYDAKASQRTPYTIIGGTQDNGGRLMNANGTWINTSGGDAMTQVMDTTTTRTFYSSCYGGAMYRTTNNWTSNTIISNNFPGGTPPKSNKWIMPFCLDANNPAKIIACYDTVWTSIDRGNTWAKASNYNFGGAIDKIGVTKKSSRVIYVSRGATVYRTGDTGLTWAAHSLAGINAGAGMNCIQVSPIDSNTVWVTCDGYNAAKKVFKTTDGGVSWSNISGSLPNVVCNGLKYENGSNNRVYLGTEYGGLYYIDDSMTDWAFYGDGLPNVEVRSVDIRYADKKLILGTWGRGIWTGDLVNNATATIPYCDFSAANTVVRRGASATFSDLSTNTATSWAWNFPGGTPSSSMLKSPIIQYNTAGNYDVTLTVTNAAGTDSKTKTNYITVSAVTVPNTIIAKFNASKNSVAGGTTINFTDISTGAPTTWEWTFEGGLPATSTAQNPSITYNAKGTYRVMLTAKNGNGSNSVVKDGFIVTSSVVVGVETEHNDIYTAYSTKKTIYVNLKQSAQVYIYDLDGKLIETKPVLAGLNQFSTGISSGVYIVKIMLEKEVFTKRIIVE